MFEMLTHPLQCRRLALIEWKHCVDSAASLQVLAEEPRGKKKCSSVHIVRHCYYAVSAFTRYKTKREKKSAIDEPTQKRKKKL